MKHRVWLGLLAMALPWLASAATPPADYVKGVEAWRARRLERLKAPDGWLTLIGLHFLEPGDSTVGHAPGNVVVLAAGPDHLGILHVDKYAHVTLSVNPGVDAKVDGHAVVSADLEDDRTGKPTEVTCGTMSFYVIFRGGKLALRVKNSEAERRVHFLGIDHFPIDPSWRIEAKWEVFPKPKEISISNVLGQVSPALVLGRAVFTRDGRTLSLLPIQESPGDPLFFIISDATSGDSTYAAARFLYADAPEGSKVVLDFNKAVNPPCAFTPFATCPLPPAENRLPIAVTAGEKKYRGEHE